MSIKDFFVSEKAVVVIRKMCDSTKHQRLPSDMSVLLQSKETMITRPCKAEIGSLSLSDASH